MEQGNGWRAGTAKEIGVLQGELNAIHRLLADPETGLSAINRKVTDVRHEMGRMKSAQFALGGLLVAAGAVIGGAMPQIGQRILSLTARIGDFLAGAG